MLIPMGLNLGFTAYTGWLADPENLENPENPENGVSDPENLENPENRQK